MSGRFAGEDKGESGGSGGRRGAGQGRGAPLNKYETKPTVPGQQEEREPEQVESEQAAAAGRYRRSRRSGETSPTQSSPSSGTPPRAGSPPQGGSTDRGSEEEVGALTESVRRMTLFELAPRPGYGQTGKKLYVFANHYELRITKPMTMVHYYVDVAHPRVKLNRDDKRIIFWACVEKYSQYFGPPTRIVFDGDHICVSHTEFKFSTDTRNAEGGNLFPLDIKIPRFNQVESVSIRLQTVGVITFDAAQLAKDVGLAKITTPLTVLDLLFRQHNSCPMMETSKAWYPFGHTLYRVPEGPAHMPSLGYGQVIWQGLFGSARLGQNCVPFINFDVSHTAFTRPSTVIDFAIEVLNCRVGGGPRSRSFHIDQLNTAATFSTHFVSILNKDLIGLNILCRVKQPDGTLVTENEYRSGGLSSQTAITAKFEMRRPDAPARQISVAEYFKERYNIILRYPNLPVISAGSKRRPAMLPMEFCFVQSCQRSKRKLLPDQTAEMIKVASINAPTRQQRVSELVKVSNFANDQWLKEAGIQIDPNMKKVDARVLPSPRLECANKRFVQVVQDKGTWDQRNEKFYMSSQSSKIGAIIIDPAENPAAEIGFLTQLLDACRSFGLTNLPQVIPRELGSCVRPDDNANAKLEATMKRLREQEVDMVVVVIPAKNSPYYGEVKRLAEINFGVMTQCVTKSTVGKVMGKGDRQVLLNIALKINAKLGGICWKGEADNDAKKVLYEKPTCVLGIDVTHPSPTERKAPSIAAVVGNVDRTFMQYGASVRVQKHRREGFVYIMEPIRERLNEFFARAGAGKPERIVVYRDGVSESQFQEVLNNELVGIREACSTLGGEGYKPSITFIVAQKRHHTRFFPMNKNEAVGRGMNVFQGTVVDKVITHPKHFEFYLCSHAGIQGTSRPIRYHVLTDDSKFSADELQKVTFYLSHCFARCNRPVSLPAPLYYADLVCRRARIHLQEKVDFSSDTMSTSGSTTGDTVEGGISSGISDSELMVASTVADPIKAKMYFT